MSSRNPSSDESPEQLPEVPVSDDDVSACLRLLKRVWPRPLHESVTRDHGDQRSRKITSILDVDSLTELTLDRFHVRERIGEGGFGIVFLAFDTKLNREVAIKVPRPHVLAQSHAREHFLHEAQAAALLDHPGIVPVYEVIENGLAVYIVSAHCSGESLAGWLSDRGPVKPKEAAWLVAQLADAVRHAHSRGVLHRDLKPANVLLVKSDAADEEELLRFRPKLTDFGLAKIVGSQTRESMSQFGTAHYMSPEQVLGRTKDVGVQSDVFSLGVILYELLAGVRPFEGEALVAMRQVVDEEPKSLRSLCPDVPLDLARVCQKSLGKSLDARYATADEFLADLERFLRGDSVMARPLSVTHRSLRWMARRPLLAAMTLAVVASIAFGLGGILWQWRRAELNRGIANNHAAQSLQHLEHAEQTLQDFAWLLEEKILWAEKSNLLDVEAYQRLQHFSDSLDSGTSSVLREPLLAAMESFRGRQATEKRDFDRAKGHYESALTLWRSILHHDPDRLAFRRAFALCIHGYSSAIANSSPTQDPSDQTAAAQLHFGADPTNATDAAGLLEYVDLLCDLAQSYRATDRLAEAITTIERAQIIAGQLTELYPNDAHKSRILDLHQLAATVWKKSRRPGKAQAELETAVLELQQWEELGPLSIAHQHNKVEFLLRIGGMHRVVKKLPEARTSYEAALKTAIALPPDPSRSAQIAAISKELGLLCLEAGEHGQALDLFATGRTALEDVTKTRALSPVETRDWADLSFQCGKLYRKSGNNERAFSALAAAINGYVHPYAEFSLVNRDVRLAKAESFALFAELQAERGQLNEALTYKKQALEVYSLMASKKEVDRHAENRVVEIKEEIDAIELQIAEATQAPASQTVPATLD